MRDEHCHIVWDVDDGSKNWDESVAMLDAACKVGIDHIVATPHMRWKNFDQQKIKTNFEQLQAEAYKRGIAMELGYEVYYDTLLAQGLENAISYVREGTTDFLVEFNTGAPMAGDWERVFYELQTQYGLGITLAHPERYTNVLADFEVVFRVKEVGCRVQVSAGDLFHKEGLLSRSPLRHMAKCARWIVEEGLCDAIVSDAHNPSHYAAFAKAMEMYG